MKKLILIVAILSSSFCAGQVSGLSLTENISEARKLAKEHLENANIPGMAISVSKDGDIIWSEGYGYMNTEIKKKVSPSETQFRIASISKSLTAAGLAKLMDEEKLNLDESLYIYLPNYPKKKYDFTIRQIGGHLAGIRHYNGSEFVLNKKMSITEGLDIFKDDALLHEPGSRYRYSTYGWNLLSEVIQVVAKTPFNEFMQKSIFAPLEMNNTTLDLSDALMPNRTQFYIKTNGNKIVLGPEVSNEHKVAGGGFISTSEDLVRFGNEIISPNILSKESVAELLKPQSTSDGKSTDYGVGFGIAKTSKGTPKYSHTGGGIGATTVLLMYPQEKVVIAVVMNLSQASGRSLVEKLEEIFID